MADWKDILPDKEEHLTDEDLLKYLHEDISEEERYDLEKKMENAFEMDAIAGLQQIKDTTRLQNHVKHLHQKLPKLLRYKKKRLEKKRYKDFQWIMLAVVLLLLLCILAFLVVYFNR